MMNTPSYKTIRRLDLPFLPALDKILISYLFPIGLIVQLTGVLWIGKGSGWVSQTYTWLMLPAFISVLLNFKNILYWRPGFIEYSLTGFLLLAFISKGWSDTTLSWGDVLKRCLYIGLYVYALVRLGETPEKLKKLLVFCCGLVVIAALLSVIYRYGVEGHSLGVRDYRIASLMTGSFADLGYPIMAGIYYAIFASLLFAWQAHYKVINPWLFSIAVVSLLILGFYILETWSRGAWMAAACGLGAAAVISWNKRSMVLLFIAAVVCAVMIIANHHVFDSRLVDSTYSGRTDIWKDALHKIAERPWLGYGYEASFKSHTNGGSLVHHPHSYFIQVVRLYGIVGGLFFVGMLAGLGSLILKYRHNILIQMAAAALIAALVGMITDVKGIITRPSDAWLYVWLPLGIILGVHYQRRRLAKNNS